MKKTLTLLSALLLCSIFSFGQNNVNLVVFAEDGDAFYVYVNGVKQNQKPESNVRVAGISPNIALRIEFENKALPQLKKNMSLEPGFEHTARIKRDKNQQVVLRYFGQVPIEQASTDKAVATVNYHSADNTATETSAGSSDNTTNMSVTSTTTTSNVNNSHGNVENATINVGMPGISISMNVNDPNMNSTMQTTSSTTVTSTTSTTGYDQTSTTATTKPVKAPVQAVEGCSTAMSTDNFTKMKSSVASKPFSDTKMSTAKVATKNSCLSVNQVKEIAKLFNMDEDKLAYAKYAYDYCVDKANYYQVSDIFSFSTTADELNSFLAK